MSPLYDLVQVSPRPNSQYLLLEDFTYKDTTVPKGYLTNGADIPRILWSIIPPNKSDNLPAVIIHDYLCDLCLYEKADNYFKECLQELEVHKNYINILYTGVRSYHYIRYDMLNLY